MLLAMIYLLMDKLCSVNLWHKPRKTIMSKNMVIMYRNLFKDPGKQINTKRLMLVKSMVERMISLKDGKKLMPESKTNLSLLVINS